MKFLKIFLPVLVFSLYLGVSDGNLALFRTGSLTPLQVYPYPVSAYPYAEQRALQIGIPIESDEHLTSLLENFLS